MGHRELPQTKGCQNLINIQTTAVITGATSFTLRVVNRKGIKGLSLGCSGFISTLFEPKVLHVLCHCYAAVYTHTHTHSLSLTHTHTHTHTLSLSLTHTHTHTHTHTQSLDCCVLFFSPAFIICHFALSEHISDHFSVDTV